MWLMASVADSLSPGSRYDICMPKFCLYKGFSGFESNLHYVEIEAEEIYWAT